MVLYDPNGELAKIIEGTQRRAASALLDSQTTPLRAGQPALTPYGFPSGSPGLGLLPGGATPTSPPPYVPAASPYVTSTVGGPTGLPKPGIGVPWNMSTNPAGRLPYSPVNPFTTSTGDALGARAIEAQRRAGQSATRAAGAAGRATRRGAGAAARGAGRGLGAAGRGLGRGVSGAASGAGGAVRGVGRGVSGAASGVGRAARAVPGAVGGMNGGVGSAVQGVKASSWVPGSWKGPDAGFMRRTVGGNAARFGLPLAVGVAGNALESSLIDRSDGYSTGEAFGRGAIKGAQVGSWFGPAGTAVGAAGVGLGEGISNMIFPGQNRSITNVFDNVMSGNFSGEDVWVSGRPVTYMDPVSGEEIAGDRTTILPSGERVWKDATALQVTAAEAGLDEGMQAQFSDSFEATRAALMGQGYDEEQAVAAAYDITLSNLPQVVAQQQADAREIWKQNQLATMLSGYINEFGPKGGGPVAESQRAALALLPAYMANQAEQEQIAGIANSVRQRQQQMAMEQMFGGGGGGANVSLTAEDLEALAG